MMSRHGRGHHTHGITDWSCSRSLILAECLVKLESLFDCAWKWVELVDEAAIAGSVKYGAPRTRIIVSAKFIFRGRAQANCRSLRCSPQQSNTSFYLFSALSIEAWSLPFGFASFKLVSAHLASCRCFVFRCVGFKPFAVTPDNREIDSFKTSNLS